MTAQLDRYQELENDIDFLSEFSQRGMRFADMAVSSSLMGQRRMFFFGKYKGQTVVSVLQTNPGYFSWIQQADFPLYTKKILTQIKLRISKMEGSHIFTPFNWTIDVSVKPYFLLFSTKKINLVYGHRTSMSMKNQDTWDEANKEVPI